MCKVPRHKICVQSFDFKKEFLVANATCAIHYLLFSGRISFLSILNNGPASFEASEGL